MFLLIAALAASATAIPSTSDGGGEKASRVKDVYFAGFFPMLGNEKSIGGGIMPAIDLAIRHINESPDILPDYKLHMLWNDTECNPGVGLKSFFDMVHQVPHKMFLYGASCSPVTDQIAKAARHWNLVQVTARTTTCNYKKSPLT